TRTAIWMSDRSPKMPQQESKPFGWVYRKLGSNFTDIGVSLVGCGRCIMRVWNLLTKLGLRASIEYGLARTFSNSDHTIRTLHPRQLYHPLLFRSNSSDISVFSQIFVQMEYASLINQMKGNVGLVVDLGANVGFSSAYFLSAFPDAHVIAVEPDPQN